MKEPLVHDALERHLALFEALDPMKIPERVRTALASLDEWSFAPDDDPQREFQRLYDTPAHPEDSQREARMLRAIEQMEDFADASPGSAPDAARVARMQALVLGKPARVRESEAFARGGAHRYASRSDLETLWQKRLLAWSDPGISPVCVAAGLYFEVIFLHPFENGNARCARLLLGWALRRTRTLAPSLEDVVRIPKRPGEREDYWWLVSVVAWSASARARRRAHAALR